MIKQLSCGENITCILFENGKCCSIGDPNYNGVNVYSNQLSTIDVDINIPGLQTIPINSPISTISCGTYHTCFLLKNIKPTNSNVTNNYIILFGEKSFGRLLDEKLFHIIQNNTIIDISSGYQHTSILLDNGKVVTAGNNYREQLGHSSRDILNKYLIQNDYSYGEYIQDIDGSNDDNFAIQISSGGYHTGVVTKSNKAKIYGTPLYHEFKINENHFLINQNNEIITNIKKICCGFAITCVLFQDKTIQTFGLKGLSDIYSNQNIILDELSGKVDNQFVVDILCGKQYILILLENGELYSIGKQYVKQNTNGNISIKYGNLGVSLNKGYVNRNINNTNISGIKRLYKINLDYSTQLITTRWVWNIDTMIVKTMSCHHKHSVMYFTHEHDNIIDHYIYLFGDNSSNQLNIPSIVQFINN